VWQIITVLYFLVVAAFHEWVHSPLHPRIESFAGALGMILSVVAATLTVYSGLVYLRSNWSLMKE
jgi:hypothetical protein